MRRATNSWGYVTLLGWLSASYLTPIAASLVGVSAESTVTSWIVWAIAVLPGAVIGWLIAKRANQFLSRCFKVFNKGFDFLTNVYGRIVGGMLRVSVFVMLVYGGLLGLTYVGLTRLPVGFIPMQDKGYLLVNIQLPDAASLERTSAVLSHLEKVVSETHGASARSCP